MGVLEEVWTNLRGKLEGELLEKFSGTFEA